MADKISTVLKNKLPSSSATYKIMSSRSDGRLPDRQKPATEADKKIHITHVKDSSQYNLRHSHDHLSELAYDYGRLKKEDLQLAAELQSRTAAVLNKQFTKMGLKLVTKGSK